MYMFDCLSFSPNNLLRQGLIETNVKISNEIIFSDVYRSVKYIGSLVKFT